MRYTKVWNYSIVSHGLLRLRPISSHDVFKPFRPLAF